MKSELLESKRRRLQSAMEHMRDVIDKIRNRRRPISLKGCYSTLAGDHLVIGLFKYFVDADENNFKQHLYTACQLRLAEIEIDSYQRFDIGYELLFALLSDSSEMVKIMSSLAPDDFCSARENPLNPQFRVHMWQLALQGDYAALEGKINRLAKNGRKADRVLASEGRDFFSLLIKESKGELRDLICRDANLQSQDAITEDYLSFLATLEAKICWYRGVPVEIDHPLVPMKLMPIRPLEHYDDVYDFLKPGWQPPPQGFFGKLSRFFGRKS